nr:2,3,4,5-tetrahydropyridine-2,6-dicarboxylate N-succinyltransferase [Alphaproteobacteria bacterium]
MTDSAQLQSVIDAAWEDRDSVDLTTTGGIRDAVNASLDLLDSGQARVAEKTSDGWQVNQWLKKAVLLSFRLNDMTTISGGPGGATWGDKVPHKFDGWSENEFRDAGFRAVPQCTGRRAAHLAPNVVLMPRLVHLGALVGSCTPVDTRGTGGSCA